MYVLHEKKREQYFRQKKEKNENQILTVNVIQIGLQLFFAFERRKKVSIDVLLYEYSIIHGHHMKVLFYIEAKTKTTAPKTDDLLRGSAFFTCRSIDT